MKVIAKQNKIGIIIILLVMLSCSIFLSCKSFNNRKLVKEENKVTSKRMSVYQKAENSQEYVEINTVPNSGYRLNTTTSYCKDKNNVTVSDVLSYNNGKVTVTSNKTLYCYLYFDRWIASEVSYVNTDYTECGDVQCALDELYGEFITPMPQIGNFVTLDNQAGIYYRVLYNDSGTNYMLLRMNNDLEEVAFNSNSDCMPDSESCNSYEGLNLDTYMNEIFYNSNNLTNNIRNAIVDKDIVQNSYEYKYDEYATTRGTGVYTYQFEYAFGGDNDYLAADLVSSSDPLNRKVYALDIEDIYKYMSAKKGSEETEITSEELMNMFFNTTGTTTVDQSVWLRSSAVTSAAEGEYVDSSGSAWYIEGSSTAFLNTTNVSYANKVRPAFLIDLRTVDFEEIDPNTITLTMLGNE